LYHTLHENVLGKRLNFDFGIPDIRRIWPRYRMKDRVHVLILGRSP
jgi:hypothetical protein